MKIGVRKPCLLSLVPVSILSVCLHVGMIFCCMKFEICFLFESEIESQALEEISYGMIFIWPFFESINFKTKKLLIRSYEPWFVL